MRKHPPLYLLSLCLMMVRSAGICDRLRCAKDGWRVTILQRGKEGYNSFQVRTSRVYSYPTHPTTATAIIV